MRVEARHGLNAALRNNSLEFVQSTRSVEMGGYAAPNLEYALSGLSCRSQGENWRFLHQIFFKLSDRALNQTSVDASADEIDFEYGDELTVSYCLDENRLLASFESDAGALLHAKVFADIRHMYGPSRSAEHLVEKKRFGLVVSRGNRRLAVNCSKATGISTTAKPLKWWFPADNEEREVFEAGEITCKPPCTLVAECFPADSAPPPRFSLESVKPKREFAGNEMLKERLKALSTFGVNGFPEAGGLWFRNTWFRDSFEGLLNNYAFYSKASPASIGNALKAAKSTFENGLVANKLSENAGEKPAYNAVDSTLLYYLLCLKRGAFNAKEFEATLDRFKNKDSEVFLDGLLYCPANYSWTDEIVEIGGKRFPTRLPRAWFDAGKDYSREPFALVEVNALWHCLLAQLSREKPEAAHTDLLLEHALAFKKRFLPHLPHAVSRNGVEAKEFHSAKITALALLDLPRAFVETQFELAKPSLAFKNGKLFGVAVNPSSEWPYQGKSVWPRDNPYLARVLEKLGLKSERRQLLESSLEPGACLFYCQECFSFPDLKPLKNPIQYWSHFVQPFLA